MGLNDTQSAERVHIGFFGMRNAGKSSVVNRVTNQNMSTYRNDSRSKKELFDVLYSLSYGESFSPFRIMRNGSGQQPL